MRIYKLESNLLVYTPSILALSQAGFRASKTKKEKKKFVAIMAEGYSLPVDLAERLVSGTISHTVEGDAVVFSA
jgi:hypothetical protein